MKLTGDRTFRISTFNFLYTYADASPENLDLADSVTPADHDGSVNMSSSAEESTRNWLELPRDITAAILLRAGTFEILNNVQWVCSQWRSICKDPSLWRTIDMRNGGDLCEGHLEVMCREAVDRSCGGLVDISIEGFGTDELLRHIPACCTGVKHLRLVSCYDVSDEGLCETAAKLPLLEDLELSDCSFSEKPLEHVGGHCPHLMSLKLNCQGFRFPHIEADEEALAIAKTMPELRCLQLFGNKLTNVGLEAILNGCPHLEFLDLRQCFNVNLTGNLWKRCAEKIKDLRRPLDPTDDYKYDSMFQDDVSLDEDDLSGFSDIEMVTDDDDHYDFSRSESDYDGESSGYLSHEDYDFY